MVQLIERVEDIKKNIRGRSQFSIREISFQNILCQIVANVDMKRFHMVTHSYAALFSIKTNSCETNKIF